MGRSLLRPSLIEPSGPAGERSDEEFLFSPGSDGMHCITTIRCIKKIDHRGSRDRTHAIMGVGIFGENEEVEGMACATRVFCPRSGIYMIHDYRENRGVTAPEGAGFLERINLRHPLWDVYDYHTVVGDDRQPETVVPTLEDNLEDRLTSCRAGSLGSPLDWKSRQSLRTSPLRHFCETCGSDINLSSAIIGHPPGIVECTVWEAVR